jgi:hypothetical protein
MCEASQRAENIIAAQVGEKVAVVQGGHIDSSNMFARADNRRCLVCVPFGAVVSFERLPGSLQARLQQKGVIEARMVKYDSPMHEFHRNRDDTFEVVAGGRIGAKFLLSELSVGTTCEIVRIEEMPNFLPEEAKNNGGTRGVLNRVRERLGV